MNRTAFPLGWANISKDSHRRATQLRVLALLGVIGWIMVWMQRSTGGLSIEILCCVVGFVVLCALYGRMFEQMTAAFFPNRVGMTYQLLTGFLTFNTLLFVLTLASPFGIALNVAGLGMLGLLGIIVTPRIIRDPGNPAVNELPGVICIIVTGAAATLWVSEIQPAMDIRGPIAVFRAWPDIFIHVREISAFAQMHGMLSMSDIKMAGAPASVYHFASYISAAAFSVLASLRFAAVF